MLAPHHAENAEFGDVGIAAEDLLDAQIFVARHSVFGDDFRSHFDFGASGSHFYVSWSFSRASFRDSDQIRLANHWQECRFPPRSSPAYTFPKLSRLQETREIHPI